ncbi:MAG: extracellular solute-binding protein [Rhodopseudomonas sp.]|uniref:molybdate ABC transporter substrate-binding protein n=1 Tax=Rhodopseudomonas sp. TaxID=1078 RepID=UPI0017AF6D2A|nr:extracellular solute-binding protein [Rhodopseudomonas sp.]NVN87655.1 extracellular solute-binding protein [Rhodopseudomonas sp.]
MRQANRAPLRVMLMLAALALPGTAWAGAIEVFHADSLAGPMRTLKQAFEAKNPEVTLKLTPGTLKQLAERILKGEVCDVFAPSSPAVVEQDLLGKTVAGSDRIAASWYVVFSGNEMVVITAKGNPLGIGQIADLAKPGIKLARIAAEKDLATARTVEFLSRAAALEGHPELAKTIIDAASATASVPDTVRAVKDGTASAGVVYYSAAVAAKNDLEIVRFADSVNMSEAIRNAALVPGTAANPKEATAFVRFLLTPEAQTLLQDTGQPPVVPALFKGEVPAEVRS